MRRSFLAMATAAAMVLPFTAFAKPVIGEAAPAFDVKDAKGADVSLDALQGKTIVLEWVNFGCPFVKKHYGAHNMQALQEKATKDGVVWISVFSSAEGKEGYQTAKEALADVQKQGAHPTHIVMDPDGTLGKLYDAKTTPHLYVVDKEGTLAYMGAIDDKPSANPDDIKGAKNYVSAALDALAKGEKVADANTKPYGCGVKYAE